MFSPADQSEYLVQYDGGRSHDDFVAFLRESGELILFTVAICANPAHIFELLPLSYILL